MRRSRRFPLPVGTPSTLDCRSLTRKGTPWNGPAGGPARAAARARSNISSTTALSRGLWASMRRMASSTSSVGETSFRCTSSARPKPSYPA
jgi:hypothetical protein